MHCSHHLNVESATRHLDLLPLDTMTSTFRPLKLQLNNNTHLSHYITNHVELEPARRGEATSFSSAEAFGGGGGPAAGDTYIDARAGRTAETVYMGHRPDRGESGSDIGAMTG